MAVELLKVREEFLGTGAPATYSPGIYAKTADQIKVYEDDILQAEGVDYTLDGLGNTINGVSVLGTFVNGADIVVKRDTTFRQQVQTVNNQTVLEDVLDDALDKAMMVSQEIDARTRLALRVPEGEAIDPLPNAAMRALRLLWFDALGEPDFIGAADAAVLFQGQPGGNTMSIGLFAATALMLIPIGTDLVQTSGYAERGIGQARYVYDAAIDAAYVIANPLTSFMSGNGRGFKIAEPVRYVEHYNARGDDVTDDAAAINAAIADVSANGHVTLAFTGGKTYRTTATIAFKSNIELLGHGATIRSSANTSVSSIDTVTNVTVHDLKVIDTSASGNPVFDFYGTHMNFYNTEWSKVPSAGGYIGYFRQSTAHIKVNGIVTSGSNGIFMAGHDHTFTNFDMTSAGLDDGFVIKAPNSQTYNIKISKGTVRNHAAAISIGSEVGLGGANEATRSLYYARTITISDVIAEDCASFAFFKATGIAGVDYRDGNIDNVTMNNCQLTGVRGTSFIFLLAARGSRIRYIHLNNCTARCRSVVAGNNAMVKMLAYDYPGGSGPAEISNIFINGGSFVDTYGGDPNGVAAPGFPSNNHIYAEIVTGAGGTVPIIGRVEIDGTEFDGCQNSSVVMESANIAGPIKLHRTKHFNYANNPAAAVYQGGVSLNSRIDVKDSEWALSPAAPAGSQPFLSNFTGANKNVPVNGECHTIPIGNLAAGASVNHSFVAPRNSWIRSIRFMNRANIAIDVANKITITVDNKDTAANLTTKDTSTGFDYSASANVPKEITGNTDQLMGANSLLSKNKSLDITIASTGTAVLAGASIIVDIVPYGTA